MSNDFFPEQILAACRLSGLQAARYRTFGTQVVTNTPEGVVVAYLHEDRIMIDRILLGWTAPTSDEPYYLPEDPTSGMNPDFYWRNPQGQLTPSPI